MSRTYFLTICVIIFQHTGRIFIRYYAFYIYIYIYIHIYVYSFIFFIYIFMIIYPGLHECNNMHIRRLLIVITKVLKHPYEYQFLCTVLQTAGNDILQTD